VNASLQAHFLALLEKHVHKLAIRGNRATGCCPFHPDRSPSFSADLEKCVWYCFPCGRGGGVKAFAEAAGETWNSPRDKSRAERAHQAALAAAKQAYADWQRKWLIELTDEYRALVDERDIVETAYRASHRRFDLYSEEERAAWTCRLSEIYDRLAILEHDIDVLTFKRWEAERLRWWREEEGQNVRHAA
jgi:hypothetical protein